MECNLIDGVSSRVIVLNRLLTPDVEDLDHFIGAAAGDTGAIRVEFHGAHSLIVVMEGANVRLARHIPQLAGGVLGPRGDQARVRREHGRVYPVSVRADREHESAILQLEHLHVLVVGPRQQEGAIL